MKKIIEESIRILNLKASWLVEPYQLDNSKKKRNSDGTIPFSLFSLYLQKDLKQKIKFDKLTNSFYSNCFISVDFKCCYKEKKDDKTIFLTDGKKVEERTGTYKVILKSEELREKLYTEGFDVVEDGNVYHYVFCCRTAAKSRVGNALFVLDEFYKPLVLDYMLLGLDFSKIGEIDIPSLETYKSLVCSSIIDYLKIDKDRICIVDDEELKYESVCSVTSYTKEDGIKQEDKLYTVSNKIWDGEGLIDSSLVNHNMVLLRNNFFKCCCLSTNIQDFKKKYNIKFFIDKWGNKIENPQIITTPSSIKFFKFSNYFFKNDEEGWEYWKKHSYENFGIVKYNKKGKFGNYGQMSYQVVNSLPCEYSDILELLSDELQYIQKLRSDEEEYFKLHIHNNIQSYSDNFINTMSNLDDRFYNTKLYKKYKNNVINKYISDLKCSHIKIKNLDYYTVFSLPQLLLKKATGMDFDWNLEGNICYCPTFTENELFCWRNPHISTSNLGVLENYLFDSDLQFFNIEEGNIIIVNTKNNLMNQMGGMDFDSDTIAVTNNKKLIELAKVNTQFKIPVLDIEPTKIQLNYTLENIAKCDNSISKQKIGEIVNLSALLLSYYYDKYNKDKNDKDLKLLSDMINLLSNCSMMEIDSAKKQYDEEVRSVSILNYVRNKCSDILEKDTILVSKHKLTEEEQEEYEETGNKELLLKEKDTYVKPLFFKFAQDEYKDQYCFRKFECGSDFIVDILDNFKTRTKRTKNIEIDELLQKDKNFEHANRNQILTLIDRFKSYNTDIYYIVSNKNYDELEKLKEKEKTYNSLLESVSKMKITDETIYCILCRMFNTDTTKFLQTKNKNKAEETLNYIRHNKILILTVLSITHKNEYIKCFKNLNKGTTTFIEDENGNIEIWGKTYTRTNL